MHLTCPVLDASGHIPLRFARHQVPGGANVSLPLRWTAVPASTASFVLTIVDHHPIARRWVHWAVANLPGDLRELPEGASRHPGIIPARCVELRNTFGDPGYGGPQPPAGTGPHSYVITLYAISTPALEVEAGTTMTALQEAMKGRVISTAQVTGLFGR